MKQVRLPMGNEHRFTMVDRPEILKMVLKELVKLLQNSLPKPSLITGPAKIAYMVSIYFKGVCGGNDFWRPRLKEDGLSAGQTEGHWVEKKRYRLIETFHTIIVPH
jgi:hypothetical protein